MKLLVPFVMQVFAGTISSSLSSDQGDKFGKKIICDTLALKLLTLTKLFSRLLELLPRLDKDNSSPQ